MRPLNLYLLGTGSWFAAFGIQSVLFSWLVTMQLNESPTNVGFAQMSFLLPTTVLILFGGSLADRFGARRLVIWSQTLATLPLAGLLYLLVSDSLTYPTLLVFAVLMGIAQAFVTPSRDGLLNHVAGSQVQRAVVLTSLVQFGLQMVGLVLSTQTSRIGPEPLLVLQIVTLLFGVLSYWRIPASVDARSETQTAKKPLFAAISASLREGAATVFASAPMRSIVWLNIAMGVFFMGSYMVATPLLLREHYSTDASALAGLNAANSLGLFVMALILLRIGTLLRPGRALLMAQIIGGLVLALGVLDIDYWAFVAVIFVWGLCGGVAMSMSRSIMQEQAPAGQRSRVMSFYSLAMMGAGPIGALWAGFMCDWLDARTTLLINGLAMTVFTSLIYATGTLARLRSTSGG